MQLDRSVAWAGTFDETFTPSEVPHASQWMTGMGGMSMLSEARAAMPWGATKLGNDDMQKNLVSVLVVPVCLGAMMRR